MGGIVESMVKEVAGHHGFEKCGVLQRFFDGRQTQLVEGNQKKDKISGLPLK